MAAVPRRILQATLKFNVDKADTQAVIRDLTRVEEKLKSLNKLSTKLADEMARMHQGGQGATRGGAIFDFSKSEKSAERLVTRLKTVTIEVEKIQKIADQIKLLPPGQPRLPASVQSGRDFPNVQKQPIFRLPAKTESTIIEQALNRLIGQQKQLTRETEQTERHYRQIAQRALEIKESIQRVGLEGAINQAEGVDPNAAKEVANETRKIAQEAEKAATQFRAMDASLLRASQGARNLTEKGIADLLGGNKFRPGSAQVKEAKSLEDTIRIVSVLTGRTEQQISKIVEKYGLQEQIVKNIEKAQQGVARATEQQGTAQEKVIQRQQQTLRGTEEELENIFRAIQQFSKDNATQPRVSALALSDQFGRDPEEMLAIVERFQTENAAVTDEMAAQERLQERIKLVIDKVTTTIGERVSQEEQLYQIIRRIATAEGVTLRDAAEYLATQKGISAEVAQRARQIGRDPNIVQQAKDTRIAEQAARRAIDATKEQATEEEKLAQAVLAVGRSLRITRAEAAKFVAQMDVAGGRSADDLARIAREFASAEKAASGFGQAMRFGIAGFTTQIIGVQIKTALQPFFQLPKTFADFAGKTDAVATKYLQQTGRIEQAQLRVGRAVATSVLPVMERIAEIAERVADFSEENPGVVTKLGTLVAALLALATALQVIGFTLSAIGTTLNFANMLGVGAASGGASAAGSAIGGGIATAVRSALPVVLALLPAIVAAVVAHAALSRLSLPGRDESILQEGGRAAGQVSTLVGGATIGLVTVLGKFLGVDLGSATKNAEAATVALGKFFGVIEDGASTVENKEPERIFSEQTVNAVAALLEQMNELEVETAEERQRIIMDGNERILETEREYAARRASIIADFAQSQQRELEDFQNSRSNAIRDFVEQNQRAEEDYLRRRSDLIEEANERIEQIEADFRRKQIQDEHDHLIRVEDLVAARDALGLARELRRFKEQQALDEQEHAEQIAQERENLADRLEDLDEQYEIERQRRAEDFQQRLADQQAEFDLRRQRELEDHQARLRELDQQKREELAKIKDNIKEQLDLLDERYEKERENLEQSIADQIRLADSIGITAQAVTSLLEAAKQTRDQINQQNQVILDFMQQQLNAFNQGLNQYQGGNSGGGGGFGGSQGFATGGYVAQAGVYALAEAGREYVLSNEMTKRLEAMTGGRLTDKSILALSEMSARRQTGPASLRITVEQNGWRFEGALSAQEREAMRSMVKRDTLEAIKSVIN